MNSPQSAAPPVLGTCRMYQKTRASGLRIGAPPRSHSPRLPGCRRGNRRAAGHWHRSRRPSRRQGKRHRDDIHRTKRRLRPDRANRGFLGPEAGAGNPLQPAAAPGPSPTSRYARRRIPAGPGDRTSHHPLCRPARCFSEEAHLIGSAQSRHSGSSARREPSVLGWEDQSWSARSSCCLFIFERPGMSRRRASR